MNQLIWKHGFTQRESLNTDTDRVRQILREGTAKEQPQDKLTNIVERSVRLEQLIAPNDQLKAEKLILISAVFKSISARSEKEKNDAEKEIITVLCRKPKLSSYVSFLRQELER